MKAAWPALSIELWPIERLAPYARNARTHSAEQIAQIAAAIAEWGWTNPVLVDEQGNLIAGEARFLAGHKMGVSHVPVVVARGWTPAQIAAFRIADNKLAELAGWDKLLLGAALNELAGVFDLNLLGFSPEELAALTAPGNSGLSDPDDVPETPATPVSRAGDVWVLGMHRLTCGDATVSADVDRVLAGDRPHLMVTDPPYGVAYDPSWRQAVRPAAETAIGKVLNDDRADWSAAWQLFPGDVAYVWHGGLHAGVVDRSLTSCGFNVRAQIIWVKQRPALSRGHYHWQHEPAFYAVREGAEDQWRFGEDHEVAAYAVREGRTAGWHGGRRQTTVWDIEHAKNDTGHGTQKPVECMKRPIENNSGHGQAVYEPFSGSGTTIIAAEMTGRYCRAIELSPAYVDVGVRRWEQFTGKAAVLEQSGRTFAEVEEERRAA